MKLQGLTDLSGLLRLGLSRSVASLFVKVLTAGLTYLTYVVLSRMMDGTEYGYFAFGLSLATVLAIGAGMGQQTAILRFWPEETVGGRAGQALASLRAGGALTVLAGIFITLALVTLALAIRVLGGREAPVGQLYGAAALILPLALAEYFSSALRAQGSVWTALVPRDLIWRAAVPIVVAVLFMTGIRLMGISALLLTALGLVAALGVQVYMARWRGYHILPGFKGLSSYWGARGGASRWFLLGTVIDSAALNVDVILVGLMIAPESAGVYFNAFRTAGLLTLFMFAITLVVAPMVAEHYHAGEMRKAQAVTALCAWAGFAFSLVVFAGFVLFGDQILGMFGEHQESGTILLILLSIGLLFDAATGPSRIVMMMTGHERAYVRIFGLVMLVGMAAQVVVIPVFGLVGAAATNMAFRIVAQIAIAWWSRKHIGLDTSLLGAALINRQADRPHPVAAQ